jgi:hypothetical protein
MGHPRQRLVAALLGAVVVLLQDLFKERLPARGSLSRKDLARARRELAALQRH